MQAYFMTCKWAFCRLAVSRRPGGQLQILKTPIQLLTLQLHAHVLFMETLASHSSTRCPKSQEKNIPNHFPALPTFRKSAWIITSIIHRWSTCVCNFKIYQDLPISKSTRWISLTGSSVEHIWHFCTWPVLSCHEYLKSSLHAFYKAHLGPRETLQGSDV